MLSYVRRLVGAIQVTEDDDLIHIKGIPTRAMRNDIYSLWRTNRVNQFMFTHVGHSDLKLPRFFALELLYALTQIASHPNRSTHKRAIRRMRELLLKNTWLQRTQIDQPSRLDYNQLRNMRATLYDHQLDFLKAYDFRVPQLGLKGYIFDGAPGSGKTITGLALSLCLEADQVVIVSPKNAIYKVWEKTIKDQIKGDIGGITIADRDDALDPNAKYVIVHYEGQDKLIEMARRTRARNVVVILDESHNLNLAQALSKRADAFLKACTLLKTDNVLWASGTPVKAMGSEMVVFLRNTDPMFNEDVERRFLKIFGKNSERANDILNHRLGLMSFKVVKSAYQQRQPIHDELWVSIPKGEQYTLTAIAEKMQHFVEQRRIYYAKHRPAYMEEFETLCRTFKNKAVRTEADQADYQMYRHYVTMLSRSKQPHELKQALSFCKHYEDNKIIPVLSNADKKRFRDVRSVVKYPELKIRGECLGRIVGGSRVECHDQMARHVDLSDVIETAEKKTLIFSSFIRVTDTMAARLAEQNFQPVVAHSKADADLDTQVSKFKNTLNANPLIATYDSLSTAVPLIEANTVVFINAPFRHYTYEQAGSRVDRIDQDAQVYFFNLYLDTGDESNISTRSKDILQWSKEQVEQIMGIRSEHDTLVSLESLSENMLLHQIEELEDMADTNILLPFDRPDVYQGRTGSRPASADW